MHDDVRTIHRSAGTAGTAGRTLAQVFADTAAARGDAPAYSDRIGVPAGERGWRTLSWREMARQARQVGAALVAAGVQPGDRVAVMAGNRIEHVLADLGALHAGAVPMSIYSTLSAEQVTYVAGHSEPVAVVLETEDHLRRWATALEQVPGIRAVVVLDAAVPSDARARAWPDLVAAGAAHDAAHPGGVDARVAGTGPDSPATILYTSGTTGAPKGVVLTHRNVRAEVSALTRRAAYQGENVFVSYLPFAHIAERGLGMYVPWTEGGHVHLLGDPAQLPAALAEVRPTRFFGVPRVWEKLRTAVAARLAAEEDAELKALVERCLATGREWVESRQTGRSTGAELQARYEQVDAAVLGRLRARLGFDRLEWAASAAAPMPLDVARFFAGLGITVHDLYGMTETSGAVTSNGPGDFRLGTVGRALPGIEVRLAEDGEILTRGPVTTPGYFRAERATAELVDGEGWVHTGDVGVLDDDGFLSIVDRKKELIITSAGKNIAPTNVENLLKESPVVGHAMVVGDDRPYLVALLTLDGEIAPLVARKAGVPFTDLADLAETPAIRAMVQQAVDAANERLSRPEQVKAFELLGTEWTPESEELTPTMKVKRRVVLAKHADVIDRLYG